MTGGNADTFGNASAELRWSNDFGMTAVAEYHTFKFVVYNHFQ